MRTLVHMTTLLRSSLAAALLVYAISALVPPVWPCPIDWERIPLATFVRCSVALDNVPAPCDRVAARPQAGAVSCPAPACDPRLPPCPGGSCPPPAAVTPPPPPPPTPRSRPGRAHPPGAPARGA